MDLSNARISTQQRTNSAHLVRAGNLIERMGWEHLLKERGADLSVGEGQLVTFARAMAHDPTVVIG